MRSAELEMVRVGLTKVTFQQRLEGHEGMSSAAI